MEPADITIELRNQAYMIEANSEAKAEDSIDN